MKSLKSLTNQKRNTIKEIKTYTEFELDAQFPQRI